jgi:hypothetical protein
MMMTSSDVSLLSLDSSLALVGGYAGTVWMIISCLCGGYSDFSYSNALVRDFVKRRKKNRENQVMENDENLEKAILNTEPINFNYWTYQLARLTVCFSCCK